jgi:hypothetical protein
MFLLRKITHIRERNFATHNIIPHTQSSGLMKNPLTTNLLRLCTYLVKGFCACFLGLVIFTLSSWVLGLAEEGLAIFLLIFPFLLRSSIMIGCAFALTSFLEGI